MIHHFNQRVTADAKMYRTCLYVKCTMIYDHICTQFWRSVSATGHGNAILNKLPPPIRVRSRRPQWQCMVSFMLNTHTWCMQNHYSRGCCLLLKLSRINIQEPNVFYILMIIYNKTKLPRIHFKASILKL